ncbi:MAG TPA: maltose ABC transporter permease MalF [Kofleriaceae bacterium]|nr:maltose ABC transporter permease MalF [Kofleriaceae bacterium]
MLSHVGTALAAGISLLALFVYTSRRAYTYRYLFPGLVGIAVLTVLPLIYTVWLGFTNYSSAHLLTFERATEVLLGEVYQADSARYQFSLHPDGDGFRIILRAGDDEAPASDSGSMLDSGPGSDAGAGAGSAAPAGSGAGSASGAAPPAAPAAPPRPTVFVTPRLPLTTKVKTRIIATPLAGSGFTPGDPLPLREVSARAEAIKALAIQLPDGSAAAMSGLREMAPYELLYERNPDGSLVSRKDKTQLRANFDTGYYETADGKPVQPGFRTSIGFRNYVQVFTDQKFRGPFVRVFIWTIVFAGLTVFFCTFLGMVLAEILSWEGLRFAGVYRVLLFLPYAVPGFISILVFKGLFNHNFGEINLILDSLLGIRPDWNGNPWLARLMILIVNVWLGYPYFMLLCMGLQKAIPRDLYEASALAGAGPLTNFFRITWPLIRKPLTPLIISSFAFNFNNFVLIFLLTGGRPDFLDTNVPAGETDLLVSYTYRIAFQDSGQNIGLAATISTVIFAIVAILSVINLRMTKATQTEQR